MERLSDRAAGLLVGTWAPNVSNQRQLSKTTTGDITDYYAAVTSECLPASPGCDLDVSKPLPALFLRRILEAIIMVTLRTLGVLDLRDGKGVEIRSVLQQPKRVALLAFLTIANPSRYHRRDSLLAMFWPELDQEHGRAALRRSLHFLRAALGPASIEGRGEEEVGVPSEQFWCDAVEFAHAVRSGDHQSALELYRGNLLEGFHLSDSPAFQDWLETERGRLRRMATTAAWSLVEPANQIQSPQEAVRWARMAFDLNPDDEDGIRRLLRLLDAVGDRAAAIEAFEGFVRRLARDQLQPTAETSVLMSAIRTRSGRSGVDTDPSHSQATPAASVMPLQVSDAQAETAAARRAPNPPVKWRPWIILTMGLAMIGTAATVAHLALSDSHVFTDPRRVLVEPFQNRTGQASLDPLGLIAADWIARGLGETHLVQVVDPSASLVWKVHSGADGSQADGQSGVTNLRSGSGPGTVVVGSYYRQRDTLYFEAKVLDGTGHNVLTALGPAGALETQPLSAIERLRQLIMVGLAFRIDSRLRNFPGTSRQPTYEAYRHFVAGIELHTKRDYLSADREFVQAAGADSAFYAPLILAAVEDFNLALDNSDLQKFATADSLIHLVAPHRAQLSPLEATILDWLSARLAGDLAAALGNSRKFAQIAPGTVWEYQGAYDALLVNHPAEAIRILARMDPDRGPLRGWMYYWAVRAVAHHVLGEHRQELYIAEQARERFGATLDVLALEMGALAALGRVRDLEVRVGEAEMARPAIWARPGIVLMKVAQELQAHGYSDAGRRIMNRALTWYRNRPHSERMNETIRAEYGEVLYSAGEWRAAQEIFNHLIAQDSNESYLGLLGRLAARRGDSTKAREIFNALAQRETPYLFGQVTYNQTRIASLLGQQAQAVELLRRAFAEGLQYGTHSLHSDPDLMALRGYPPFEELLRPKDDN